MAKREIRIGTRASDLALWQARKAREMVMAAMPDHEVRIVEISTSGDEDQSTPLALLGGQGVFVKRIETALMNDEIDIAVHSAKDLPSRLTEGLALAASPKRGVVNDALVCRNHISFKDLPEDSVVGTSSPRRAAQLLRMRPKFTIRDIRGNVDTRLRKVDEGQYDATMLAWAGMRRLGKAWRVDDVFSVTDMLPAPAQGIVALQVRGDDEELLRHLNTVSDEPTFRCLRAERKLLRDLNAGCHAAVAALASDYGSEGMRMVARVLTVDGETMLEAERSIKRGEEPETVGEHVAAELLELGAGEIIEAQNEAGNEKE